MASSKHTRLFNRLRRSLKDWDPEADGPLIEIGTLVEALPFIPSTSWAGALADTRADGYRPRMTPGIEGRKYQGMRLGVLARGLHRWIVHQNPRVDVGYVDRLVNDLARMAEEKRAAARRATADGVRKAADAKRQDRPARKPRGPKSKEIGITSDALFKVW